MRYAEPCSAYSLYIMVTLLQVPDGVMAAYESQSEEEEMDEICGTLVQSRHCLQAIQAETRLNIQQHRAVSFLETAHTVNIYNSFDILKQITSRDNQDLNPPFFPVLRIREGYTGSRIRIFPSRIQDQKDPGYGSASKNLSIFNPKNCF